MAMTAVNICEKGYSIGIGPETYRFKSFEPIEKYLMGEIDLEELERRHKNPDVGKVLVTVIEDLPRIYVVWHNLPEKKWKYFRPTPTEMALVVKERLEEKMPVKMGKRLNVKIGEDILPALAYVNHRPVVEIMGGMMDFIWIIKNFKEFEKEIFRMLGVE